jgi:hypothetical protein
LTTKDDAEIAEMLHEMQVEQKEMRIITSKLMWHMRGSLSRQEAWTLSLEERKDIIALIAEHKEMTEKTGLPLM